ncbi:hypothetical protein HPB49_005867 [Dermacentor silvarum]|uniref:Uncharacterized protein n=1 Tax=Dermacentor silvarum TaxID=543639 RepID=A0ACB8CVP4_DERSI|nr:hypothetical protein HPB49_005867 [Dermacentor silvarum]
MDNHTPLDLIQLDFSNAFDVLDIDLLTKMELGGLLPTCVSRFLQYRSQEAHYGSLWASYNLSSLREWMFAQNESLSPESLAQTPLGPGERLMLTAQNHPSVFNAKEIVNVPEKLADCPPPGPALVQLQTSSGENSAEEPVHSASAESATDDLAASCPCPYSADSTEHSSVAADVVNSHGSDEPVESEDVSAAYHSAGSSVDATYGSVTQHTESILDGLNEDAGASGNISGSVREPDKVKELWSMEKLLNVSRKFNLDLAPKLLFSRGPLVELLISSNIARYAEFKALTRILTMHNGNLQQVPCSRADVFSCKNVTVVEKRMLMKFLTFCKEFEQHPDEYRGFEGRPFLEFLESRQLSKNVEHYVLHAIAMVDGTTPTLQALKSVQKFLDSLGRYGNSPFLASLYGSGELPQCFCRLCAVYGGIYHLQRGPSALLVSENGTCIGIVSNGRRFNCRVSRAIVISDESLLPAEREQITLLRLQRSDQLPHSVMVQEQGPGMMVCPPGLYIVHLTCPSVQQTAEQDLEPAVKMLFDTTQSPEGPHLDYEHPVNEAREVFHCMYPNEEFLPRAPDPEEILLEHENNPGDHGPPTEERDGEPTATKTELGKEQMEKKGDEPESGKGDDVNASKRVLATSNPGGATSSGDS